MVTSYIVYRDCPGKQRQYIRRMAHMLALWTHDSALAQRFSRRDAERWALVMGRRSTGYNRQEVIETPGIYDFEEVAA